MTDPGDTGISSLAELLAHAHAIETDALERYRMLADQMEVHNNRVLAEIFRELAGHEEKHAAEILAQAGDIELPALKPSEFKWPGMESPEAADLDEAHYRMTPWHALQMALRAEQRAFAFFDHMVETAAEPEMKKWAEEFREEEAEHVELVERLLAKYPEPEAGWQDDPDPPAGQE
ncbi:MAG: ferritin-like domain-containing protein [Hyphomicrobiales bacterium]